MDIILVLHLNSYFFGKIRKKKISYSENTWSMRRVLCSWTVAEPNI
jgi:hypothetical protein